MITYEEEVAPKQYDNLEEIILEPSKPCNLGSDRKSNHQVKVIRIAELLPHNNADKLELIHIGGYQVVVQKGQFKVGDLAVYIQPDSIVPQTEPFRFIWEGQQTEPDGIVPEKKRRITVRKFRKEWSEGLLMKPSELIDGLRIYEGDDVAELLNIKHYQPPEPGESTRGSNEKGPKSYPRSIKGWFYWIMFKLGFNLNGSCYGYDNEGGPTLPVYDVEAYKNYVDAFTQGEPIVITEKIHGSNGRFYFDGKKNKVYAGSRKLWKSIKSKCVWRKALEQHAWIELFLKSHPGFALYGEVVPTQPGFTYGCRPGETNFFVFDILKPDGTWLGWDEVYNGRPAADFRRQVQWVPLVVAGVPFSIEQVKVLADGKSFVKDADHIREGVVIKPVQERHVHGLGRLMLKIVSNAFYEKDSNGN